MDAARTGHPQGYRYMDFELNEEQQMFRDVLRQFVNTEIKPVAREMEQSGEYPQRASWPRWPTWACSA